jgi:hypothetical protein
VSAGLYRPFDPGRLPLLLSYCTAKLVDASPISAGVDEQRCFELSRV